VRVYLPEDAVNSGSSVQSVDVRFNYGGWCGVCGANCRAVHVPREVLRWLSPAPVGCLLVCIHLLVVHTRTYAHTHTRARGPHPPYLSRHSPDAATRQFDPLTPLPCNVPPPSPTRQPSPPPPHTHTGTLHVTSLLTLQCLHPSGLPR
jgi:hypothetical protein